jgi:hypothetical protein
MGMWQEELQWKSEGRVQRKLLKEEEGWST